MDSGNGNSASGPKRRPLTSESTSMLGEGISLVLSRWYILRTALEQNDDIQSHNKVEHLYNEIFTWFIKTKEPQVDFYDLVDMIEEQLLLFFSIEIEFDGSNEIEEVAGHLMFIYESCLEGNYEEILRLRNEKESKVQSQAVCQSGKMVDEGYNGSPGDDEAVDMALDEQNPKDIVVEAEEGWHVVPTKRRNRSSKH